MVAHSSNIRLSGLSIGFAGRTEAANGLYANGRHQCEVVIEVVKETRGPDGEWIATPLTDEERASVTVVERSEHDTQTLTAGWSCDAQRNEFALGLWRNGSAQEHQDTEVDVWVDHTHGERISRYLRCDPDAPIGPAILIARVVIEGRVFTTYKSRAEGLDESLVTISPVRPFELHATDLDIYTDRLAYRTPINYGTDVHVYYWTPPVGVHFVKNLGFDNPLGLSGEGQNFRSSLSYDVPLDLNLTGKAGTLINKDDPASLLYLDEIHDGLPAPVSNALVRFNERPTIMRAVRVNARVGFVDRDTKSFWRLLDNYGNEQKFLLELTSLAGPDFGDLRVVGAVDIPTLRLDHFRITLPNGGVSTNELYANGRHQCKVVVEVIAEQMQPDGNWAAIRLTQAQRDSLTITRYSANVNEPLPRGWSCDHQKNIYDTGLWNSSLEEGEAGNKTVDRAEVPKVQMEQFDRYMRFDSNITIEDVRFMASIQVGGVTYTTNYTSEDAQFNSYVNIRAMQLYPRLLVKDLVGYVDIHAYTDDLHDIDVYYWTPPSGLRFLVNSGLTRPMAPPNEGLNFHTSYYRNNNRKSIYKGGVVINKNVVGSRLVIADIHAGVPNGSEKVVRFDQRPTIMRAVRFTGKYNSPVDGDSNTNWVMLDNYGCAHGFRIEQADDGNVISLIDA